MNNKTPDVIYLAESDLTEFNDPCWYPLIPTGNDEIKYIRADLLAKFKQVLKNLGDIEIGGLPGKDAVNIIEEFEAWANKDQ